MELSWKCKTFKELSVDELYAIMRLRSEVFVVEQNCVFLDADNKDQECYHLCGWQNGHLAAYARLVPPGVAYNEPSIGRVITSPGSRGSGAGKKLLENALINCTLILVKKHLK